DTYFDYALIKRFVFPTGETKLIPFNLGEVVLEKKKDIELKPLDKIYIFSRWFFEPKPTASIEGEVRNPGTYKISEKGFRVKDLILLAGGLKKDAYLEKAELYRLDIKNKKQILITFNLKKALEGDPKHNILLKDLDRIVVHSIWEYIPKQTVSIYGEVNKPGKYPFVPGMRVKDLIFAGGNIKDSAYLEEAEITSYEIKDGKLYKVTHKVINLKKALEGDPKHNILLKPYDKLVVKKIPDWGEIGYVEITGEVRFPGKYPIRKGEKLSSLIERAGGFTDRAYLKGAVFIRKSVKEMQQKNLNEMILRLKKELLGASTTLSATSTSEGETKVISLEFQMKKELIESLKNLKALGRMRIKLLPLRLLKHSKYDIELEDGDTLYIPPKPNYVNVIGAVFSGGSFIYDKNKSYKDYIALAGGPTKYADTDNIYIIKADGTAVKVNQGLFSWNYQRSRWEFVPLVGKKITIDPGDTIVVPEKLTRFAWFRPVRNITEILMHIVVTTGWLVYIF
ncbi:MAG: polysaccharide export protein, partial [Thermodesulfobacteriota bacterium]